MEKTSSPYALPYLCKIRRRPEFTLCYEEGCRYFSQFFVVFVRKNQEGLWRFGLAVSRKAGNAVRRNRIKRVLREFFRLQGYATLPCVDMVAVPRRTLAGKDVTYALVMADLTPLLQKILRALAN